MQDGYYNKNRLLVIDGEPYNAIGGPLPEPMAKVYKSWTPRSDGALAAMGIALNTFAEQQCWFDAGVLATFRNWSNRR